VLIKSDTANIARMFKTSTMRDDVLGFFSATADGAVANLNLENIRYTWIAFAGSDCTSAGYFCLGTYTGTGAVQDLTTGFQPDFVTVKNNDATGAHFKTTSLGANNQTIFYINVVKNSTGAYISALNSDGFSVGTTDSVAGGTFHYFAFKEKANFFKQGTYDGNSTDGTIISDVGFKPNWVAVKNGTNTTANNTYAFSNQTESYGNSPSYFSATANLVNMIKTIENSGFSLGTDVKVNATGDSYYYVAFGGVPAPSSSGTFRMAQGTYSGNGTSQAVTNIGFSPDLVIVKNDAAQISVFRTKLMRGDTTAYFTGATANLVNAITSITEDGFTVGGDARTNASGNTYQWQAFGNAYDPIDNAGASDFAIGAIYGNGLDNRDITKIPFQPNMVVVKSITNAGAAVFRTSSHVDDLTSYFQASADAANFVQALNTDGFQIGSGVTVNTSAVVYFWFAFKTGDNFKVGSYTGNTPSTQTIEIDPTAFQSNLIWTVPSNNVGGITKPSTLTDPASQYFLATANANTQITAITDKGFTVGTGTGANGAVKIYYSAWKIPYYAPPTNLPDIPGSPSFSSTSTTGTVVSWTAASGADYYVVQRATDRSGSPGLFRYVATTSGLSIGDNTLNPNQKYWYRVKSSNPNGYSGYSSENSVTTNAQALAIQTGYYIGTGDQFSISGLGFAPEMVLIKSDTANIARMFKTSTMRDDVLGFFSATADGAVANLNLEISDTHG